MPQLNQIEPGEPSYQPGEAWLAAEAAGVDMALLEHKLRLTVWERMVEHQRALDLVEMLQNAKIKPDSYPR